MLPPPSTSALDIDATVPDVPIPAIYILRVLIAAKLRRKRGDLPLITATVKDLCGGESIPSHVKRSLI